MKNIFLTSSSFLLNDFRLWSLRISFKARTRLCFKSVELNSGAVGSTTSVKPRHTTSIFFLRSNALS